MKLLPLYRVRFHYSDSRRVDLTGELGQERAMFLLASGTCSGRIAGTFTGANFARRRVDKQFIPDFTGAIQTQDGATILCEYHGFGRPDPPGRRQVVLTATHTSDHEKYSWLNDVVCVGTGEVRTAEGRQESRATTLIVVDFAELVWEPIPE